VPQGLTHTIVLGLNCRRGNDFRESIGIYLLSQGGDQYVRILSDEITTCQSHGQQGTIYVLKNSPGKILTPDLDRQYSFWVKKLTLKSNFYISQAYPPQVIFDSDQLLLKTAGKHPFKGALVLKSPDYNECFLLILATTLVPATRSCSYWCKALRVPESQISAKLDLANQPGPISNKVSASFGPGNAVMEVSIAPGKVQGIDMCCVEITVS
jgi:hypothetical protein